MLDGIRLVARFRELEVELEEAAPDTLEPALVARLRAAGAGHPDPVPKIVRALGPRAADPPDVTAPPPLDFASTPAEVVQAAIATSTLRLLVNDPGVRLGTDPESVHQARVATRRLRSDLRTFRGVLDEAWSEAIRVELKWLGGICSAPSATPRCCKTGSNHGSQLLPSSDVDEGKQLLHKLAERREHDRVELLRDMRSDRYLALLDQLVDASRAPKFADRARRSRRRPVRLRSQTVAQAPPRRAGARPRFHRSRAAPGADPREALPVRGRGGRIRAWARRFGVFAKAVTELQDVLGEHQDAVIAGRVAAREQRGRRLRRR